MFRLIKKSAISRARLGKLTTAHGVVRTPFFMPIATRGAVKCLSPEELTGLGAQIILANTYHLFLRPGLEIMGKAGSLHEFMGWSKSILTDSGGYQVFSLARTRKINEQGVEFRSEIDGRKIMLTPELAMEIQQSLGSDIMMILDECTGHPTDYRKAALAVDRTSRWAERCKKRHLKNGEQLLFGIIQGSVFPDLRLKSAMEITAIGFDGYAIGGLAVGEPIKKAYRMIELVAGKLDQNKPRYLMGMGKPEQIVQAVKLGIDMFDCVIPTRNARHGLLYVNKKNRKSKAEFDGAFYQELHITNARYRNDFRPLDETCSCFACRNFSRAYLRHLFANNEPLSQRLASIHNLAFYLGLMEKIRGTIKSGKL